MDHHDDGETLFDTSVDDVAFEPIHKLYRQQLGAMSQQCSIRMKH